MTMNLRDRIEGSEAIETLNRLLDDNPQRPLVFSERHAIRTLIRIAEAAATPPKPESNVTHFYREF